jgi:hypothetical protein
VLLDHVLEGQMTLSNLKRADVEDVDDDGARMGFLDNLDEPITARLLKSSALDGTSWMMPQRGRLSRAHPARRERDLRSYPAAAASCR